MESHANRTPAPSVQEVRRVAAIANPVIRNLEITHCYSRLARGRSRHGATRARTGARTRRGRRDRQAGPSVAKTCSRSSRAGSGRAAGCCIRFATLWRRLLRRGLFQPRDADRAPDGRAAHAVRRVRARQRRGRTRQPEGVRGDRAGVRALPPRVPAGRIVESPRFQRFLDDCGPATRPMGSATCARRSRITSARLEPDPKARAELAVLANLEIGLHEQTRLQPEIREALDAAYVTQEDLGRRALEAALPVGGALAVGRRGVRPPPSPASSRQARSGRRAGSHGR